MEDVVMESLISFPISLTIQSSWDGIVVRSQNVECWIHFYGLSVIGMCCQGKQMDRSDRFTLGVKAITVFLGAESFAMLAGVHALACCFADLRTALAC